MRFYEILEANAAFDLLHGLEPGVEKSALRAIGKDTVRSIEKDSDDAVINAVKPTQTAANSTLSRGTMLTQWARATAARSGLPLVELPVKVYDETAKTWIDATSPIVRTEGRAIVVTTINGKRCPFYLSTGDAGKKMVPAGKWYPIFGIGPDGWINKGSEAGIANYYGVPALRSVAQQLDRTIGDIRTQALDVRKITSAKHAMGEINRGLNPVAYADPNLEKYGLAFLRQFL